MSGYDKMGRSELVRECRRLGLPVSGKVADLKSRLAEHGSQHPSVVEWEEPPAPPQLVDAGDRPALAVHDMPDQQPPQPSPTEGYDAHTRTYWVMHPLDGPVIDDARHTQLLEQTCARAVDAGYRVRGGLYAGRRVSFSEPDQDGQLWVTYEVSARKQP